LTKLLRILKVKNNTMKRQKVIDLTKKEAKEFFLRSESYCNFDLPEYFDFNKFLVEISKFKNGFDIRKACNDDTSYVVYNNKDGKYVWRKLQLIHPILYLELIDTLVDNWDLIQNHFKNCTATNVNSSHIYVKQDKHKKQKKTQILSYLEEIEKRSIKQSLEFKYISKLDIADCYPSVYTHAVSWALHTKSIAKDNRKNSFTNNGKGNYLVGNDIDYLLRSMQGGQTNGIPQGSILMDFIAEIILISIDKLLEDRLGNEKITKYRIIRYRDDYRIFTKEKSDCEKIIKALSEILAEYNFRLNANKIEIGEDITLMSIKKDKLENIIYHVGTDKEIDVYKLKRLLIDILNISRTYPNSGFILKILEHFNKMKFYEKINKWYLGEVELLITILINITVNNPRCFAVVCISIFNLLPKLVKSSQCYYIDVVYNKLLGINNVGYNAIWLQRCLYKVDTSKTYQDRICQVVNALNVNSIFGNHFISDSKLKSLLDKNNFIERTKLSRISKIPKDSEVNVFDDYGSQ